MRYTGVLQISTSGDVETAMTRVSLARTLQGRMLSYLNGADGGKRWQLNDGTVIFTKVAGGLNSVKIDVSAVSTEEEGAFYFVYLFGGSQYYGEDRAQGFKVTKGSDTLVPIGQEAMTHIPVRSENHGNGKMIVVLCTDALLVYKADPSTGKLALLREDAFAPGWDDGWWAYTDFYATQDPNKYAIVNGDSYVYDISDGSLALYSGNQPASYARTTVGRRNHHPSLPLFYKKQLIVEGDNHRFQVQIFTYTNPEDTPSLVQTWEWDCAWYQFGEDNSPRVSDPIVSEDGKDLMACFQAGSIITRLDTDGITPIEHKVPSRPFSLSGGLPASTTDAITFPLGGGTLEAPSAGAGNFSSSPWNGYQPLPAVATILGYGLNGHNMKLSDGTVFFNDWLGSNDSSLVMQAVRCFDDDAQPNYFFNYPVAGDGMMRVGQWSVPLIDGSRVIRSVGQQPVFNEDELQEEYRFVPKLSIQKPSPSSGYLAWQETGSKQLAADDYNSDNDVDRGVAVIRALSVFEPLARAS